MNRLHFVVILQTEDGKFSIKKVFLNYKIKLKRTIIWKKRNQIEKYLKIPIQRTHQSIMITLYQILSEILRVIQISVEKCIL